MLSPATAAAVLLPLWATQAWAADVMVTDDVTSFNQLADDSDGFPRQTFRSSPVVAPVLHVNAWNKSLTDDGLHLFIGNNMNPVGHGAGPMIFSAADLSLVYADQSWGNNYHSEPQTIGGEPHLTFWASEDGDVCVVMDSAYKVRYRVYAVEPHRNDMHDLHITDEGTAVFTTHRPLQFDCSRWGGPADCTIQDTGFQEVDLETGEALFSWFAADHWDPDDSHARFEPDDFGLDADRNGRYDLSHNNGARKTADGHYLVSSRHYWHVQLVNGSSGEPVWTFGGNRNDFRDLSDGRATNIAWQHNPRLFHNDGDPDHVVQLSLFDNHAESQGDCGDDCHARGLHVELDTRAMTARLVREYPHPDRLDALAMGGMQIIPGSGNALAGWGWTPSIVEYSPDGEVALDIQKGRVGGGRQSDMFAYRAFKAPWSGRPTWPPSMALDKDEGAVYVSWNGATDVAAWRVVRGPQKPCS